MHLTIFWVCLDNWFVSLCRHRPYFPYEELMRRWEEKEEKGNSKLLSQRKNFQCVKGEQLSSGLSKWSSSISNLRQVMNKGWDKKMKPNRSLLRWFKINTCSLVLASRICSWLFKFVASRCEWSEFILQPEQTSKSINEVALFSDNSNKGSDLNYRLSLKKQNLFS